MIAAANNFWTKLFFARHQVKMPGKSLECSPALKPVALGEFLRLEIPTREMLLNPILPERSLSMLYAPRGLGKSWLALSIGLPCLGYTAAEMDSTSEETGAVCRWRNALVALQERLQSISAAAGDIANDHFQLLAADNVESGINLASEEGQQSVEALLSDIDLLILDNLLTLCPGRGENASDAWLPMQQWLLRLRRKGLAVLLVHHAGNNGRQRGTSRREDALDTVIALRWPENYSPEQGCRFEVHFEKLRNRVDGNAAIPFVAKLETVLIAGHEEVSWADHELAPIPRPASPPPVSGRDDGPGSGGGP